MKRVHALILAVAIGLAVVFGSFAALRTTHAAAPASISDAQVAKQKRALDRAEASLRAELNRRPPAVTAAPPSARAQTVIYHRPPPVVHVVHRSGGEGGNEHEGGEGLDD